MAAPTLRAHGASHPGRNRANNEDRLHLDPSRGLFIVADGMGGHAAGERAAEIAVTALRGNLEREGLPPAERLREAFRLASREILATADANPAWAGMACVATAAIVHDGRVTIGHVGDTRAYLMRHGSLRKITRDHSPVGEREDRGELSEQEAMRHPRRHEVFRDLGSRPADDDAESDNVEVAEFPFDADTALLLCTDGLTDLVQTDVISRAIRDAAGDGASVVGRLVDAANAAGGRDNVSVIYVEGPAFAAAVPQWPGPGAGPNRRGEGRSWLVWVLAGVVLLSGLVAGALAVRFTDSVPSWLLGPKRPASWSRTWTVGAGEAADGASITAVLAMAEPGDTVRVEPGLYHEQVVLDRAIHLVSARPREAVLAAPAGAGAEWTAVDIRAGGGGRVNGFTVAGETTHAVTVGVRVADSAARVEDVEVRGATRAGIEVTRGASPTVNGCYVHDNPGAGVLLGDEAAPTLAHNVITRNGTEAAPPRAATAASPAPAPAAGRSSAVFTAPGPPPVGSGLVAAASAHPILFGNIIIRNADGELAGLDADELGDVRRDNILEPPAPPAAPPAQPRSARPRVPPGPSR
jgi:serine/threonine protein phosphatase PrpC